MPPEVLQSIPSKWMVYFNTAAVVCFILGRAYHAIRCGGGLVSIWRGLLYGDNGQGKREAGE